MADTETSPWRHEFEDCNDAILYLVAAGLYDGESASKKALDVVCTWWMEHNK